MAAYLCYEGTEKVLEVVAPHRAHAHEAKLGSAAPDPHTLEEEKVAGAVKTDFILSAEIMAITLAAVSDAGVVMQAIVLALVGIGITIAVYGLVAIIVKIDDVGVALARNSGGSMIGLLGRALVLGMPGLLTLLGVIGTAAMIWVGGGIIVHGIEVYGIHSLAHAFNAAGDAAAQALPFIAEPAKWTVVISLSGLFGLLVGAVSIPLVGLALAPAWRLIKPIYARSRGSIAFISATSFFSCSWRWRLGCCRRDTTAKPLLFYRNACQWGTAATRSKVAKDAPPDASAAGADRT